MEEEQSMLRQRRRRGFGDGEGRYESETMDQVHDGRN